MYRQLCILFSQNATSLQSVKSFNFWKVRPSGTYPDFTSKSPKDLCFLDLSSLFQKTDCMASVAYYSLHLSPLKNIFKQVNIFPCTPM